MRKAPKNLAKRVFLVYIKWVLKYGVKNAVFIGSNTLRLSTLLGESNVIQDVANAGRAYAQDKCLLPRKNRLIFSPLGLNRDQKN